MVDSISNPIDIHHERIVLIINYLNTAFQTNFFV